MQINYFATNYGSLIVILMLVLWFRINTPLHYSAYKGHVEVCNLLLHSNADPQATDSK